MSTSHKSSYQPEFGESGSISGRISSGHNIQMKDITSKAGSKAAGPGGKYSDGLSGFINNGPAITISQSNASGNISNTSGNEIMMKHIGKKTVDYEEVIIRLERILKSCRNMLEADNDDIDDKRDSAKNGPLPSEIFNESIKHLQQENTIINEHLDEQEKLIKQLEEKIEIKIKEDSLSRDVRLDMFEHRRGIYFELKDLDLKKTDLSKRLKYFQKILAKYDWNLYEVHKECNETIRKIGQSRKTFIGKDDQELEWLSKESAKVGMIIQDKGDLQYLKDEINEEHDKINMEFDKIQARKNALTKRLNVMHQALNPDNEFK